MAAGAGVSSRGEVGASTAQRQQILLAREGGVRLPAIVAHIDIGVNVLAAYLRVPDRAPWDRGRGGGSRGSEEGENSEDG